MTLSTSPESVAMSKDLRKRGWAFVGPTTLYAMMQSNGIVNDHLAVCQVRAEVERERAARQRGKIDDHYESAKRGANNSV